MKRGRVRRKVQKKRRKVKGVDWGPYMVSGATGGAGEKQAPSHQRRRKNGSAVNS